jgi:subtilisin family serine protease
MKSMTATIIALFVLAAAAGMRVAGHEGPPPKPAPKQTTKETPLNPRIVPGEMLVKFRDKVSDREIAEAHRASGAHEVRRFTSVKGLALVKLPEGKSVNEALSSYRSQPGVEYATPNYLRKLKLTPNDPYFVQGKLWGLQNLGNPGVDIHAPDAWNLTTGSGSVVVMVIDSGIDYTHQDLAPNMWRNTADCFNDGIDHDNDGWINDCYGINPAYGNGDPMDDTQLGGSHGTFMAGIIGAVGNNGVGVVGVNWQVSLMACKAFDSQGNGSDANIIACLDYALMMKQRGVNIVATNNSLGGAPYDPAMFDAIVQQMNAGILFIAAAANGLDEDENFMAFYPANYDAPNVIAVAALDINDQLYPGSGFGGHTVHLGAPGGGIFSTTIGNGYDIEDGTSNAAAFVAGVAALLAARDPNWDWRAIKNLILTGGDNDPALRNILNDTITGKRLNAYGSMTCSNSTVQRRFRPVGYGWAAPNIAMGSWVGLSMLNINCASPAGPPGPVIVQPGNVSIPLLDDGNWPDLAAGDGLYSALWAPPQAGYYTLTFPGGDAWPVNVMPAYVANVVPFTWETITGINLNMSDDSITTINVPFQVTLGGASSPAIGVDSNGRLNFYGFLDSNWMNIPLPSGSATEDYMVAPFWDDLLPVPNTAQNVFTEVIGQAPNRKLVVEWRDVSRASGCQDLAAQVRFQVVFGEGSPDVQFNYLNTAFGGPLDCAAGDHGAHATIGLETVPSLATQFSYDTPSLKDNMSIHFSLVQAPPSVTAASRR